MNNEEKKQYLRRYQAAKRRAKMIHEEVLHRCVIQTVSFVRHILCYSMGL